MVSGGTYGTEQIISGAGYGHGILILLFLPILWCLPTAFMIGELSSALPCEGGYYAWVRRGLGNFWGFQEAWLSLAASIFDMAIYPTLFVFYLKQMSPWFAVPSHGVLAGLFVVISCAILNLAGIRVVGITSLWLFFCALRAVRLHRRALAIQSSARSPKRTPPLPPRHKPRPSRRRPRRHVELHGLGQRLHHRGRSRKTAAHLSARNDRRGRSRLAHLRASLRRRLLHRHPRVVLRRRRLMGHDRRHRRRKNSRLRMAPLRHRSRRHDERLRHVQRARDELLAPAASHGARRHAPQILRQDH